jgi:hypothetical protein
MSALENFEEEIIGGETISRKTKGLKILGINKTFFKSLSEKFKSYMKDLKNIKKNAIVSYNTEKDKAENKDHGFEYPFNMKVAKFEDKYLGDLIITQEILLRKLILQALSKQSFQKLGIDYLLPPNAKRMMSHAFSIVVRYKRLHDIFYRAASVRENEIIPTRIDAKETSIYSKYELPSTKQMETIIQYSLDTPICLNLILSLNGLRQYKFSTKTDSHVELSNEDKVPYTPLGPDGGILLGEDRKQKSRFYIDRKTGEIRKVVGSGVYDIVGLNVEDLVTEEVDPQKEKPNEVPIDALTPEYKKNILDNISDFFDFSGKSRGLVYSYHKGDVWEFKWDVKDQFLQNILQFRFREKLKDNAIDILPSIEIGRKKKTRRATVSGGKTQKQR